VREPRPAQCNDHTAREMATVVRNTAQDPAKN
jgi:hypothetical protein